MRKLEAVVKEITDEMGYLQRREMKMRDTNGMSSFFGLNDSLVRLCLDYPIIWPSSNLLALAVATLYLS